MIANSCDSSLKLKSEADAVAPYFTKHALFESLKSKRPIREVLAEATVVLDVLAETLVGVVDAHFGAIVGNGLVAVFPMNVLSSFEAVTPTKVVPSPSLMLSLAWSMMISCGVENLTVVAEARDILIGILFYLCLNAAALALSPDVVAFT